MPNNLHEVCYAQNIVVSDAVQLPSPAWHLSITTAKGTPLSSITHSQPYPINTIPCTPEAKNCPHHPHQHFQVANPSPCIGIRDCFPWLTMGCKKRQSQPYTHCYTHSMAVYDHRVFFIFGVDWPMKTPGPVGMWVEQRQLHAKQLNYLGKSKYYYVPKITLRSSEVLRDYQVCRTLAYMCQYTAWIFFTLSHMSTRS